MLNIRPYQSKDLPSVVKLWHACNLVVPWNEPEQDITSKINFQPELFFVGELDGELVATCMAGYEGHRGWINYLAVLPIYQRQGFGRRMMEFAEEKLRALGCPKINLQIRAHNTGIFPENTISLRLFEKRGFRHVGIREKIGKMIGVWRDVVLLERRSKIGLGE